MLLVAVVAALPAPVAGYEGSPNGHAPTISIINPMKSGNVTYPTRVGTNFLLQIRVANALADGGIAATSNLQYSLDAGGTWSSTGLSAMGNYDTLTSGTITGRTYGVRITTTTGNKTLVARVSNAVPVTNVLSNAVPVTVVPLTTPGDGKLLVRDNSSQLCADCHAGVLGHTSETTTMGYGSWSTNCRDCHSAHGTKNLGLVSEKISAPALGAGSPTDRTVVLRNLTAGYTTGATNSGYANDAETGVCQVCHTRTQFYRQDGYDYPAPTYTQTPSGSHYPNEAGGCVGCHKHTAGLGASCTNCHGDNTASPRTTFSTTAPPRDTCGNLNPTGGTGVNRVGAHGKHLTGGAYSNAVACSECHVNPPTRAEHGGTLCTGTDATNGRALLVWGPLAKGTARGINDNPSFTYNNQQCASTYCHGAFPNGLNSGAGATPAWGGTVACGGCHAIPPPPAQVAAHSGVTTTCTPCHPTGYSSTTVNKTTHMDGIKQAGGTTCYDCHGDSARALLTGVETTDGRYKGAPPTPTPTGAPNDGVHLSHVYNGTTRRPLLCDDCHTPTPTSLTHSTGSVEFGFSALAGGVGVTAPSSPNYQCNGTYCHGDSAGFPAAAKGSLTQPTWWTIDGSAKACSACHKSPPTDPVHTTLTSRSQTASTYCYSCHNTTMNADGTINLDGMLHVNGSFENTTTCASCHGNPPVNSPADLANAANTNGVGAHSMHSVTLTTRTSPYLCTQCHPDWTGNNLHANGGAPQMVWTASLGPTTSWADGTSTCTASYCHGNGGVAGNATAPIYRTTTPPGSAVAGFTSQAQSAWGGNQLSPIWTTVNGTYKACTACHAAPPGAAATSAHPLNTTCNDCHPTGATTAAITAASNEAAVHADGHVDVQRTGCTACHGNFTLNAVATSANPIDSAPGATGATSEDTVGGTAATSPGYGVHRAHLVNTTFRNTAVACNECHAVPLTNTDVAHALDAGTGGARATIAWGTESTRSTFEAHTPAYAGSNTGTGGTTGGTCSDTYCHSPKSNDTAAGVNLTPNWAAAGSVLCGDCHGLPPVTGSHTTSTGCDTCHIGYTSSSVNKTTHMNGSLEVSSTCLDCHNAATGSIPRARIVGGTAGTEGDDFIRSSRHVSNGTTTSIVKNVDCILCHAEGSLSSTESNVSTNTALHGADGGSTTVDLRDLDSAGGTGVAAQWPGKRKAAFTATVGERDQLDWFCMTCHDGDGASGVSVNANADPGLDTLAGIAVTQLVRAGTTVTATVPSGHGLLAGDAVNLTAGVLNAGKTGYDFAPGVKTVATSAATTITYTEAGTAITRSGLSNSFRRYVRSAAGSMSRTTTTVTVTTATAHGFAVGQVVALTPGEANYFSGWKTIATVPTTTSFTYAEAIATAPPVSTRVQYFVRTTARAKTPFNTLDNLLNARENGSHQVRTWRTTNNKVIAVKNQFNSENLAGSAYASHHNLNQFTKRYGSQNAVITNSWATYTSKDGVALTGASGKEMIGLHCSDCHINEANAHGSRNTWYMLAATTAGANNDYDVAFSGYGTTTDNGTCVRCHAAATYAQNGASGANSRTTAHQGCSRTNGTNTTLVRLGATWTSGTTYGAPQMVCLGCHGGFGGYNNGPGLIHGSNEDYDPTRDGATYSKTYRFLGTGGVYRYYSPDKTTGATSWSTATTGGCYNLSAADTWGGCTTHTGANVTNKAGRNLDY